MPVYYRLSKMGMSFGKLEEHKRGEIGGCYVSAFGAGYCGENGRGFRNF